MVSSSSYSISSCFFLLLISTCSSNTVDDESNKVSLILYYETLCPYCSNFIVNELITIFDNGLSSIVDLKLVPYGNAKIGPNQTITCQHGPSECLLNTVEACAMDIYPDLLGHFPFIYCVESFVYQHKYSEWMECFEKVGLDSKLISDCYNSGHGKELELKYAAETNALEPPHKYVPWVLVDGQPLYDDYEYFVSYVCKAYNGTDAPQACIMSNKRGKSSVNTSKLKSTIKSTITSTVTSTISSWIGIGIGM